MAETQTDTTAGDLDEAVCASPSPQACLPLLCHHYFPIGNKAGQDPAPESPTQDWLYRRGEGGSWSYSCEPLKVLPQHTRALPAPCRRIPGRPQPPARSETPACGAAAAFLLPEKRRKAGVIAHGKLLQDSGNTPLLQRGLVFMQCCRLPWGEGCLEQPQAQG